MLQTGRVCDNRDLKPGLSASTPTRRTSDLRPAFLASAAMSPAETRIWGQGGGQAASRSAQSWLREMPSGDGHLPDDCHFGKPCLPCSVEQDLCCIHHPLDTPLWRLAATLLGSERHTRFISSPLGPLPLLCPYSRAQRTEPLQPESQQPWYLLNLTLQWDAIYQHGEFRLDTCARALRRISYVLLYNK